MRRANYTRERTGTKGWEFKPETDSVVTDDEPIVSTALWEDVTFPSRAFGAGTERKYFDYLRSTDNASEALRNVKDWILVEFRKSFRRIGLSTGVRRET